MLLEELVYEPFAKEIYNAGLKSGIDGIYHNSFEDYKLRVLQNKFEVISFECLVDSKPSGMIISNIFPKNTFNDKRYNAENLIQLLKDNNYKIHSIKRIIDQKIFSLHQNVYFGHIQEFKINKYFGNNLEVRIGDSTSCSLCIVN